MGERNLSRTILACQAQLCLHSKSSGSVVPLAENPCILASESRLSIVNILSALMVVMVWEEISLEKRMRTLMFYVIVILEIWQLHA